MWCPPAFILETASVWAKLKAKHHISGLVDHDGESEQHAPSEIRPQDIQEVVQSCVSHRLRLRSEQDQLAAFWTEIKESVDESAQQRQSVPTGAAALSLIEEIIEGVIKDVH
ncbi:hypothetical protein EMMF5_000696 [Cystobasidiomycetes sp. EMM_F5]